MAVPLAQRDTDEGAEGVVGRRWRHFDLARAVDLADVVGMRIRFDKLADRHSNPLFHPMKFKR